MEICIAKGKEIEEVFALRFEVFVDEQKVPREIELDSDDERAIHIIAKESGVTVGCARLLLSDGDAHIGRLAVKKSKRGSGVGSAICRFIIEYCRNIGYRYFWLNAQLRAADFYERLGFKREGSTFMEAGIEHIRMVIED